jgi:ABC-type multidrug transport system fused ATPase/permease subunit
MCEFVCVCVHIWFTYTSCSIRLTPHVYTQLVRGVSFFWMGLAATRRLHDDAFRGMMRAPMSFFNLTPIGKTLNVFSKDMDDVDDVLHDNTYMVCFPVCFCLTQGDIF